MITGIRMFVVVILLLAVGTIVVPVFMRQNQTSQTPQLTVLIDGKSAGKSITVKADDTVYPCKKSSCALPSQRDTNAQTFTIAKLTDQHELVWVIDATDVLKQFNKADLTVTVDTANQTVTRVSSLQPDTGRTANLGVNLNVDENTVKIFGVIMVIVIILIGLKFMSVGGAHH
ncbi:MAG: hypothetical protein ACD_41C00020G0003 [uncultured bacterium]|nr:MAG: hypothetical protein ACD_41C00020G0003 [uncultured bacterium]